MFYRVHKSISNCFMREQFSYSTATANQHNMQRRHFIQLYILNYINPPILKVCQFITLSLMFTILKVDVCIFYVVKNIFYWSPFFLHYIVTTYCGNIVQKQTFKHCVEQVHLNSCHISHDTQIDLSTLDVFTSRSVCQNSMPVFKSSNIVFILKEYHKLKAEAFDLQKYLFAKW